MCGGLSVCGKFPQFFSTGSIADALWGEHACRRRRSGTLSPPITVAIIGAGPSGLAAAKAALECGLLPTLFEKESEIGGVWRPGGHAWEGMLANFSRDTMSFADFPWPAGSPDFPLRRELHDYLNRYVSNFNLKDYIRLNDGVLSVERSGAQWVIHSQKSGKQHFDSVIVASGFCADPFFPDIPGLQNTFKGEVIHASKYTDASQLKGQEVLVIGNSFSGADICVNLARCGAKGVANVVRRPLWFLKRRLPNGIPMDWEMFSRTGCLKSNPEELHKLFGSLCGGNPGDAAEELRIDPEKHMPFVSVTEDYLEAVKGEEVKVKRGLVGFEQNEAVFEDGERMHVDAVLLGTGYRLALPFFDESILTTTGADFRDMVQPLILYKNTFHPSLPNLAFIGLYRGHIFPGMELQARWACTVFSGAAPYPTRSEMDEGIQEEWAFRHSKYITYLRHSGYRFLDDIARRVNAYPEADLNSDGKLSKWLREGPLLSAHYRLCGPNAKREEAIEHIKDVNERRQRMKLGRAQNGID